MSVKMRATSLPIIWSRIAKGHMPSPATKVRARARSSITAVRNSPAWRVHASSKARSVRRGSMVRISAGNRSHAARGEAEALRSKRS